MARPIKRFVCQSCGAVTSKWSGRCESCGEWNTIVEEAAPAPGPAGGGLSRGGKGRTLDFAGLTAQASLAVAASEHSEHSSRRVPGRDFAHQLHQIALGLVGGANLGDVSGEVVWASALGGPTA